MCIDDDIYINDWRDKLVLLKAYSESLDCPVFGLCRRGVTLIPPGSLPGFQKIVLSGKRINEDIHLSEFADKIIDFANICKAPKEYDVARTYFLLKEAVIERTVADFYLEKMQMEYKDVSTYIDVLETLC